MFLHDTTSHQPWQHDEWLEVTGAWSVKWGLAECLIWVWGCLRNFVEALKCIFEVFYSLWKVNGWVRVVHKWLVNMRQCIISWKKHMEITSENQPYPVHGTLYWNLICSKIAYILVLYQLVWYNHCHHSKYYVYVSALKKRNMYVC